MVGTSAPIEVPTNGYLAVYLSNTSQKEVWFDQLAIDISHGNLLEENHYYPHGLPIFGLGSVTTSTVYKDNRKKYQSNEYITDQKLNWMSFGARQYDPQIGRFLSVDPFAASGGQDSYSPYAAMGNHPESSVDPNGTMPVPFIPSSAWNNIHPMKDNPYGGESGGGFASQGWFGMNSGDNVFGDGDMSGAFSQGSAAEFQSYLMQQNVNSTLDLMLGKANYSIFSNGSILFTGGKAEIGNGDGLPSDAKFVKNESGISTYSSSSGYTFSNDAGFGEFRGNFFELKNGEKEWGKNFFGDTYTGNNNPPDYSYRIMNYRDKQAYYHDRAYDNVGAVGAKGLFTNTKTLKADVSFYIAVGGDGIYNIFVGTAKSMRNENSISAWQQVKYGWESLGAAIGMFIGTTPKLLYHYMSGEAFNYVK